MAKHKQHDMRFDVRVVSHALRRGQVDHASYRKHLEALPDESDELEESEVAFATPYADRMKRQAEEEEGDDR